MPGISTPTPLDALFINKYNYIVYFSSENVLTLKSGHDVTTDEPTPKYTTKAIEVNSKQIKGTPQNTSISVTAVENSDGAPIGMSN